MGLLDEVLAAAMRGAQRQGDGAGSGSGQGGLDDLLGRLLGDAPGGADAQRGGGGLADVLGSLLGNDGRFGGLGGVLSRFHRSGLGDKADSWVSNGPNADVSGDEVGAALGEDTVSDVAGRLHVDRGAAGSLLAALLPLLIDRLTPHGQAPADGLGSRDDVLGRLGAMLRNR